ncbi:MAG TPA: LCP family protein [Micromonosporaceae bacterium]|nr:LCP family protein [Micromonosporaceae bacterium]
MMFAGIGTVALRTLAARYDGAVTKDLLLDPNARHKTERHSSISGPLNYLFVGSDRRAKNPDAGERSDTIMIAHIPAELDRAYLVSVPRDLLVDIPPHPATGFGGGRDKINAAFQFGHGGRDGTQLLSSTLTRLTGLRFDGAVIINFAGFEKVIDMVGGVEVCLDREVHSIHTGTVFPPGCQQMDGPKALDFARQRYDLPGGDFDRQRHQQQLVRALLQQVADTNLLTSPIKADQIIRGIGSTLTVDTNGVPTEDLAFALRGIDPESMSGLRVPANPQMIDDTSYMLLDQEAESLFRSLREAKMQNWIKTHPEWVNDL